jgi:hypothetical protein
VDRVFEELTVVMGCAEAGDVSSALEENEDMD